MFDTSARVVLACLLATAPPSTAAQTGAGTPPVATSRVMGDLSPAQVRVQMDDFNRALGVTCEHCHVPDQWTDESKPAFAVARNMFRMVRALNDGALRGVGEISCWTCHGGAVHPSRLPRASLDAELAHWPADLSAAPESQKLTMSVYNVSLGVACGHCHTADWRETVKAPFRMVARMGAMFAEFPKYMPPTARTQCWMCHKGGTKPEKGPR